MRRFFSRDDFSDLESELRDGRPEPRAELLDELVSRVERVPVRMPARRPRFAAALAFAVVVLVALAAFGGVGYAKSSLVSAARSSGDVVESVVKKGDVEQSGTPVANPGRDQARAATATRAAAATAPSGGADNGNGADSSNGQADNFGGNWGHHDPPWMHQYSRFVLVCYPFTFTFRGRTVTVYRTIIVPRLFINYFVPPGTPGRCVLGPQ